MKIEIDQSGKIENTNRMTVIAFSNSRNDAIIITSREKKKVQRYFRSLGKNKLFVILTFCVCIYVLLCPYLKNGVHIIVDREYPGHEKFIAEKILQLVKDNLSVKNIRISTNQIGKSSNAHIVAYKVFASRGKNSSRHIEAKEIIEILKKNIKKSRIA